MTATATARLETLARGVLVGEALSWPNAGYRQRLLPPKRLARMEILSAFNREHGTTTPAVPYAHSSPVEVLQPGTGEASEWFAFTARALELSRSAGGFEPLAWAWQDVAESAGPARIGTRIPLENIRRGLTAPQSGNDNPHYFDDLPMVRAVAAAGVFDDQGSRRDAAARDAGFTAARDGLWGADATAVLFSRLLDGAEAADAVTAAVAVLPAETWIRRLAETALVIAPAARGPLDLAHRLATEVGDGIYSYAAIAPETFAMLAAHLTYARSAEDLLLGVLAQPRDAATLPALAGAAAAILFGSAWMPAGLDLDRPLSGVGVPAFAGRPIREVLSEPRR